MDQNQLIINELGLQVANLSVELAVAKANEQILKQRLSELTAATGGDSDG